MARSTPAEAVWPTLLVDSWSDTRDTLHMWSQIIGKLKMAGTPLVNHWWNVTFAVSARGLATGAIPVDGRLLDIEFDFVDHELVLRSSDGRRAAIALRPRTVADFYAELGHVLGRLDIVVDIEASPNEVDPAIPFAEDTEHQSYDADAVHLFWQQLVQIERVFQLWRAGFAGKSSPVQFFWGSFDLACTRFSGRLAPTHPGGAIARALRRNRRAARLQHALSGGPHAADRAVAGVLISRRPCAQSSVGSARWSRRSRRCGSTSRWGRSHSARSAAEA